MPPVARACARSRHVAVRLNERGREEKREPGPAPWLRHNRLEVKKWLRLARKSGANLRLTWPTSGGRDENSSRPPGARRRPWHPLRRMPPTRWLSGFSILIFEFPFDKQTAKFFLVFGIHITSPFLRRQASESFFLSPTISKIVVLKKI